MDCLVCNRRLGNDEGVAGAYNNLGILAKRSGDLSTAIDYFERALEIDSRLGRPAAIARRLNNLGVAFYRSARWDEAETNLKRAWEIYTSLGATRDVVAVDSALGNLCRVRRDWKGARERFTRALRTSQKEGYRRAEALAFEFLGDLEKDQGHFEEALKALNRALACAHRLSSVSDVIGEVLRRRAEVYIALGRLDDAERDCTTALDLSRRIGDRLEEGVTLRVLATASYSRGSRSDARVLSARAASVQTRTDEPFELAMTALTDGAGMRRSGPVDEADLDIIESRLCEAEQLFESIGAPYWVARCSIERAKALHTAGRRMRCRVWLEKARRSVTSDGCLNRPYVAAAGTGSGGTISPRLAAVALIPVEVDSASRTALLLYADRLNGDGAAAFTEADVEFLGASARLLAEVLRSGTTVTFGNSINPEDSDAGFARGFITRDPVTVNMLASVGRLCDSTIPILMLGESGVGKDIIARAIHEGSSRTGRFVALNSGAVPASLQESELFGHAKGAFTDADRDASGLIESASGGTLFLDEIGDMSAGLQVKLLRFLQSGEYRRVGDSSIRTSDARVVSATNKDLRADVLEGGFRRDLFYRLSAYTMEIPPLRERSCDIVPLMRHFLAIYTRLEGKDVRGFSDEVVALFRHYDWRGNNVRELENEVRRCVALCADGDRISLDAVRPELLAVRGAVLASSRAASGDSFSLKDEVEALEQSRIREALERHAQSKQDAADYLGLSRTGLYTKMRKYRIE
jgi:DNA-binding NtrC family response regulator/Flp pilus assembly protein TadD